MKGEKRGSGKEMCFIFNAALSLPLIPVLSLYMSVNWRVLKCVLCGLVSLCALFYLHHALS